jgi:NAD(P)-dependent dehydrogenase (short-subunit alcohol dehydrogenase family)
MVIRMGTAEDSLLAPAYGAAIVTGGGSGIGRAVTLALAERGVDVWIIGRTGSKIEETTRLAADLRGSVHALKCDIRDRDGVKEAFAEAEIQHGEPIQSLVHAAAEVRPAAAERLTGEIWDEAVASQLTGAFNVFSAWSLSLIESGKDGVLLCYTSAVSGRETPGLSHSSATKAGVEAMIRTWAMELGRFGLRLNAIGPGLFPMPTTLTVRDDFYDLDLFRDNVPLGRFGVPDEIVGPSLFMLSRGAGYMTGSIVHVDGGLRLRPWFGLTAESLDGMKPLQDRSPNSD